MREGRIVFIFGDTGMRALAVDYVVLELCIGLITPGSLAARSG